MTTWVSQCVSIMINNTKEFVTLSCYLFMGGEVAEFLCNVRMAINHGSVLGGLLF
jgi:hypothetical protein